MKKGLLFALVIMITLLSACSRVEYTDYKTVQALIADVYYDSDNQNHRDSYTIIVRYEGNNYYFTEPFYYYRYFDKIGESVNATLETKHYVNGKIKTDLVALKEICIPETTERKG